MLIFITIIAPLKIEATFENPLNSWLLTAQLIQPPTPSAP